MNCFTEEKLIISSNDWMGREDEKEEKKERSGKVMKWNKRKNTARK